MAKPGLDGHSNGAEHIAVRAADCGLDVTYDGIRLTPEKIVATAKEKKSPSLASRSSPAATFPWSAMS